ncbi:MAG: restriction endonuclease [Sulfurimonas sp.]
MQNSSNKKNYQENLKIIGSLSNLFSNSKTPYLYYRVAEKIFCNSFLANDLSRGDVALDAQKDNVGIGLKTFLMSNNKSFQKVAEFNKDKNTYEKKSSEKIVQIVSSLRNERINFAEKLYGVDKSIYHCVVRDEHQFKIYEEEMHHVDIENIADVKKNKNSITFNDSLHDYSFNLSKSTLTKRFLTSSIVEEFDVQILLDPLEDIRKCIFENELKYDLTNKIIDTLYLPLYGKNRVVFLKSGLNQWNADGRERDVNEVYIPIPIIVHKNKPNFFPDRDKPFNLKLPNGNILQSKLCQAGSKALMSYSNKELGRWILRDVLSLREGELLTYEKLQTIGIDSVRIDKIDDANYEINFSLIGSFENFYID